MTFSGFVASRVSAGQIYNHRMHLRCRWVQTLKLGRIGDVCWEEETITILMDDEVYFFHVKVG
jgi:hypothetical protein